MTSANKQTDFVVGVWTHITYLLPDSCTIPHLQSGDTIRGNVAFAATAGYIYHRIRVADCRSKLRFTDKAIRRICKASGGIPRVINVLCHKALMVAYGRGDFRITSEHVERAIEDTDIIGRSGSWRNPFATMRGMLFPPPRISADLGVLQGMDR